MFFGRNLGRVTGQHHTKSQSHAVDAILRQGLTRSSNHQNPTPKPPRGPPSGTLLLHPRISSIFMEAYYGGRVDHNLTELANNSAYKYICIDIYSYIHVYIYIWAHIIRVFGTRPRFADYHHPCTHRNDCYQQYPNAGLDIIYGNVDMVRGTISCFRLKT